MARLPVRTQKSVSKKTSSYKPLIEALEDRYVMDAYGLSLDFGTPVSPVDKGYQQFGVGAYDSSKDAITSYGWTNSRRVEAFDTRIGTDLTRDGVRGQINTFVAEVPNGKYQISALLGSSLSYNDRITVYSNDGIEVNNLTNYRQRFVPISFTTEVKDGLFRMTLVDAGGQYRYFSLASLQITSVPTNPGTPTLTVNAGADQSGTEGTSFLFGGQVTGGVGPYQYNWNFGDGTQTSGSLTPSKTFADNGQYQVTLSVTDANNTTKTSTLSMTVNNVAPTGTFTSAGTVTLGNSGTVQFSGQTDPSASDIAAGFRYSYDFNNDGTFEVTNSTSGSAIVPASYFTAAGNYAVKGRIADKDGGYTDYTTTVVVNAPSDTTPPTATLVTPTANSTLTGTVSFSATASDNVGVTGVQYFLNNQAISPVLTNTGYTFSWNSASVSNGSYTVKAVARDAAGNLGNSTAITVTVSNTFTNPLDKPVLNSSNFEYLGSFDLPLVANGWSTAFSNNGLTHRYVNGQLQFLTTSHVYSGGLVYEFNYPGIATGGSLPTATVVNNWGDVYTGKKWVGNDGGSNALNAGVDSYGLYFDETLDRLYWSYGHWYNTTNQDNPSFGYSILNDETGVATGVGAWGLENRGEKFSRGGTLRIPQWFADNYTGGKSLGVGFGGYFSIIASGSFGPSLAAVDDPDLAVNPDRSALANTPMIGYPSNAPTRGERNPNYYSTYDGGAWNPSNGTGYWTWSDLIHGSASWIDTPELGGVLYLAKLGTGNVFYQGSTTNASGAVYEWMVYDPKDLADVASGAKQQWEIQPKFRWNDSNLFPVNDGYGFSGYGSNNIGGITYDATTGRLYVLATGVKRVDWEWYPRMYVYQVGSGGLTSLNAPLSAGETTTESSDKQSLQPASGTANTKEFHYQFGQSVSPTVEGYEKVLSTSRFSNDAGFGWISGDLWNVKQGSGATFATQGLGTSDGTFGVSLTNGKYRVSVRLGHPTMALDKIGVSIQDVKLAEVKTTAGQSLVRSFQVKVSDGLLKLRINDLSGRNRNLVIQSLDIVPS